MIQIEGLSQRQKSIMEFLWTCADLEQVKDFIKSLPTEKDRVDATSLVKIAMQEVLESEGGLLTD